MKARINPLQSVGRALRCNRGVPSRRLGSALLRRHRRARPEGYRFGEFELDVRARTLLRSGAEVRLTPKEFDLLVLLISHSGQALTRNQILNAVWGHSVFVTPRSVDQCLNTLRGKIEPDPKQPAYLKTVRGVGYRFDVAPEECNG